MDYYWDSRIEYLMNSRELYFNNDYIEFLIKNVWKITSPIHMVDFGCGFGYLGLKLLPFMPKGTKYTGIDKGEALIIKAKEIFEKLPYEASFIQADVNDIEVSEFEFDLAICQALLLHMVNPKEVLNKMIQSVKLEGKIVCIEPHRISANANIYIAELAEETNVDLGIIQKLHSVYQKRTGKDGNIGLKIPTLMRENGLIDIECRVSDRVTYLNSDKEKKVREYIFKSLKSEGVCPPHIEDEEKYLKRLIDNELDIKEAKKLIEIEKRLNSELTENGTLYNILFAPTMMISFGNRRKF